MKDWGAEEGFTLLETVLAVAILAMAFGAIYPIYATSVPKVTATQHRRHVVELAESKLEEVILMANWQGLPQGEEAAIWQDVGNGWQWKLMQVALDDAVATTDGVQGRLLHLRIFAQREDEAEQPIEVQQAFWVRGE